MMPALLGAKFGDDDLAAIWFAMKTVGLPTSHGKWATVSLLLQKTRSPTLTCGVSSNSKTAGPPFFGFFSMLILHANGMRNSSLCDRGMATSPEGRIRPALLDGVVGGPRPQIVVVFLRQARVVRRQGIRAPGQVLPDGARRDDPGAQRPHHALRREGIDRARRVSHREPPVARASVEALRACRADHRFAHRRAAGDPLGRQRGVRGARAPPVEGSPRCASQMARIRHEDGYQVAV